EGLWLDLKITDDGFVWGDGVKLTSELAGTIATVPDSSPTWYLRMKTGTLGWNYKRNKFCICQGNPLGLDWNNSQDEDRETQESEEDKNTFS
ncbi:hypothetical protein SK128_017174, partial [Halocaridina rubra]